MYKHVSWYYSVSFSIFLIWKYSRVNDLFSLLFIFQSYTYFLPARVVAWWYSTLTQLSGGRWLESKEVLWISRKIREAGSFSYQSNNIWKKKTSNNAWLVLCQAFEKNANTYYKYLPTYILKLIFFIDSTSFFQYVLCQ